MRQSAITCKAPAAVRRTRQREVRDPYDELRPWSAITHGAGAVLSAVGTALLLRLAILRGSGLLVTVFLIYGLSMTGLYTASTLYHCVNTSVAGRRALRKYDHCSIYLLIAGSYTPVCMVALRQSSGPALLAAVWAVGVVGMVLTVAKLEIPRWLTSAIYLLMGWLAIFAIVPLYRAAVYRGGRAVRRQVAGAEQSPIRLPRDLSCVYPAGLGVPLRTHVPSDRPDVTEWMRHSPGAA